MKSLIRIAAVTAAVVASAAYAEDDDFFEDLDDIPAEASDSEDAGEAEGDSEEESEDSVASRDKQPDRTFYTLPCCRELEGTAEVKIPGQTQWKQIEEGRHYPLGTIYRTTAEESRIKIAFGIKSMVTIQGRASFSTRAKPLGDKTREISLDSGTITVIVPDDLPAGRFSVCAPGFTAKNLTGESRYTYTKQADGGDEAIVRCVTQTMCLEGPHFKAASMRAANELRIRTSEDQLVTAIYGTRGDINIELDQGLVINKDYGTGASKIEPKVLNWKLSPHTAIRIHRLRPAIGERMAVTVMTFDAAGAMRNRCAFVENMAEVNSGELGPTSKKEREELENRAAEIAASQATEGEDVEIEEEGGDSGEDIESDDSASDDEEDFEF